MDSLPALWGDFLIFTGVLFDILRKVPDVVWAGVIASFLTLSGVKVANRDNARRLMLRLRHDKEEKAAQRRARRLSTYEQVWAFRQQGWSGRAIADHLGIGKATVTRYLPSSTFPERQGRSDRGKRSLLNGYKDHLVKRWNEGCQEALALFHEIVQQGYRGSYSTVARYVQRLGQA